MAGGRKLIAAAVAALTERVELHRAGEALTGQHGSHTDVPVADLETLLAFARKAIAPKVSPKGRYVKGRSFEYEVRDYFIGRGLACRRVAQSGGGIEKDDLVLTTGWDEEMRLELKRVAKLPAYLLNDTVATIFREDRGETYVLTRLNTFGDLCQ